jgi:predicted O-methyltransferase YrrM
VDHYYSRIPNTFTFPQFYTWLVRELPKNAHVVEVGSYYGASAAFFGVEAINARVERPRISSERYLPRLDLVDDNVHRADAHVFPVRDVVQTMHNMLSANAAPLYKSESLDAVMIDANHEYSFVKDDIAAWFSKVKPGGLIAGHDFGLEHPGVIKAVIEAFPSFNVMRCSPWKDGRIVAEGEGGTYFPVWWVRK